MKHSIIIVLFLCCSHLLCAAKIISETFSEFSSVSAVQQFSFNGDWRFVGIARASVCDGPIMEEYFSPVGNNDIHISTDSICFLIYPCVMVKKWKYLIHADSLVDASTKRSICKIDIEGNTMRFLFAKCIVQTFLRDTFDPRIIHDLIRDSVYAECLVGKMILEEVYSGDNEERRLARLPVLMPESIVVKSSSDARILLNTKIVYVRVRGRKRLFYVTEVNWEEKVVVNKSGQVATVIVHRMRLCPGKWWRGANFTASYSSL